MRDVARLAGVSVSTVSVVLNSKKHIRPEVAERVKEAMKALNYQPDLVARSLRVKRTRTVGMVITDIASHFYTEMVRGVQDAARPAGYSLTLCNTNDDSAEEDRHLGTLYSWRVDGVILASTYQHAAQIPRTRGRCPIVLVDRLPLGFRGDAVIIDNIGAACAATRHLIEMGHKQIALIAGRAGISTSVDREEGYRHAMREWQLPIVEQLIKRGGFSMEGGYHCGLELLRMPERATAILSCNYLMTLGLMRAIEELGLRAPEEISIVGFDDFDTGLDGFSLASLFTPKLTTVRQPAYEMGKKAFQRLLERIAGPEDESSADSGEKFVLAAQLIIRNSTAQPGAKV